METTVTPKLVDELLRLGSVVHSQFARSKQFFPEVRGDCVVIGDVHGDWKTLDKILEKLEGRTLIGLGDYVDRAERGSSLLVLQRLFSLVAQNYPIIPLRGDHEFSDINNRYGFYEELRDTGHPEWENAWHYLNDVFAQLPYVARHHGGVLMLHGGVGDFKSHDDINAIPKGILKLEHDLATQLVFNDSVDDPHGWFYASGKRASNRARGNIEPYFEYNDVYLDEKLAILKSDRLIRGHDHHNIGRQFGGKILTIHTTSRVPPPVAVHVSSSGILEIEQFGPLGAVQTITGENPYF